MTERERIAITGTGAVSPVGQSARATYEGLVRGVSGIRRAPWELAQAMEVGIGATVQDFQAPALKGRDGQPVGRFAQMSVKAAREAIADAQLSDAGYDPHRVATILGGGIGGVEAMEHSVTCYRSGLERLDPFLLECMAATLPMELIAEEAGAYGPSWCSMSACASSAHAIGQAFELLREGVIDAAICGGAEAGVRPYAVALFERLGALSKYQGEPSAASRPFDATRDGFVMGEGAGVLVMERMSTARKRGARILAELSGYGATADAFHVTRPQEDGGGMAAAIELALKAAGVDRGAVDYINAHGTGTEFNDASETFAIKRVFGHHAGSIAVSANKSMIGHLLGAAAAVETVATVHTIANGLIPPTLNLDHPDPQCDLDYVPKVARERAIRVAVKNSFGFGGQNSSLVLSAV